MNGFQTMDGINGKTKPRKIKNDHNNRPSWNCLNIEV
jgi:hypothetical protein